MARKPKTKTARPGKARYRTHDAYIADVARLAIRHVGRDSEEAAIIRSVRLAYGDGEHGTMGITRFDMWKDAEGKSRHWCAVCATCQPDGAFLLAETVLHELGHAVAGRMAAHGDDWRKVCAKLGLIDAKATYSHGDKPAFSERMAAWLAALPEPNEGKPTRGAPAPASGGGGPLGPIVPVIRPCGAGIGTKGGKSRGPGSGTRNVAHACGCRTIHAAVSKRPLRALCIDCAQPFVRK